MLNTQTNDHSQERFNAAWISLSQRISIGTYAVFQKPQQLFECMLRKHVWLAEGADSFAPLQKEAAALKERKTR